MRSKKYFIPAILWALLIANLSGGASIQLPPSIWDLIAVDKVGHLVFYGIFTFLIGYGIYKSNSDYNPKMLLLLSLIISSIYGVCLEIMQYLYFPNRYFEVLDIIANISGSLLGILFFKYIYYKTR